MTPEEFRASLEGEAPRIGLSAPVAALWWDAKGDWSRAHALVDELETVDGMAVHAYLHRKKGLPRTLTTCISAPVATFSGPRLTPNGKRWSKGCCPAPKGMSSTASFARR